MSISFVFASFFGALMIGGSYAYFNYKFSTYRFINFEEFSFWSKSEIFIPTDKSYIVVVFNSNNSIMLNKIKKLNYDEKVIAIDMNQKRFQSNDRVIFLTSSMTNLLQFVQRLNIYGVPSFFMIKKYNKILYKQASTVQIIDNL